MALKGVWAVWSLVWEIGHAISLRLLPQKYRLPETGAFSVNKIADKSDLEKISSQLISKELMGLHDRMVKEKIPFRRFLPWLRLWEYSQAITFSEARKGDKVLDAGGVSTIFSYYLALKGCQATAIDLDKNLVAASDKACKKLGIKIDARQGDLCKMEFKDNSFDKIFSICVIEHMAPAKQRKALKEMARVLKPGGVLAMSFDYGGRGDDYEMHGFKSPKQVIEGLVRPTGLRLLGNKEFLLAPKKTDKSLGKSFGMVFLQKPFR